MTRGPLAAILACAAVLLAALSALSIFVLRADERERLARQHGEEEGDIRLALWRIDAAAQVRLVRLDDDAADRMDPLVRLHASVTPDHPAGAIDYATLDAALPRLPPPPVVSRAGAADLDVRNANEYNARLDNLAATQSPRLPFWLDDQLVLAGRRGSAIEVMVLDWPALRGELVAGVADLLPRAELRPARADSPAARRVASLPLALDPGPSQIPLAPRSREITFVVGLSWVSALLALAAGAALAIGVLRLSERRAAFVSAVTHELRTPLTTLRTHAEMIEDERVDEADRRAYAGTLIAEADRLRHLVDNVLAFSQIERGRRGPLAEVLDARDLIERTAPRLHERAAAAGVSLEIEVGEGVRLLGDPIAVGQVLENLVDNACKYGAGPVVVRARRDGPSAALLSVTDAGPGIPDADRERIFTPFHKSSSRAAATSPGVGLGLALSRRLARAMHGELRLEIAAGRTTFTLTLPAA